MKRLVCHIDGASRGNPGPASIGVLVLGRECRMIGRRIGETTRNVAEYKALLAAVDEGLRLCERHGVPAAGVHLVVRTDSLIVARQVCGEYRTKDPELAGLLRTFRAAATPFGEVTVEHVPREENCGVDELANAVLDLAAERAGSGGERP